MSSHSDEDTAEDDLWQVAVDELLHQGYTLGEPLDEDMYSDTIRLKFRDGTDSFAVQVWNEDRFPPGLRQVMFDDEVTSFPIFSHPNVAPVEEIFTIYETIFVIIRYPRPPRSSLQAERDQWRVPVTLVKRWMHGVAKGLAFLHSGGFAHRNLNMSNILIKSRSTAQICGYSLHPVANHVEPFDNPTVILQSPKVEGLVQDHYKNDVWTFGVILCILLSENRKTLFGADVQEWSPEQYNQVLLDKANEWQTAIFQDIFIPSGARHILRHALQINPQDRYTMQQIASHSWFQSPDEPLEGGSGAQLVPNPASAVYRPISDKLRSELKLRGVKMLNYLSKGSYGEVHRVKLDERYGQEFGALKICDLRESAHYREISSVRERKLIRNVEHGNIIKCLALFEDGERHICILMELARSDLTGKLKEYYKNRTPYGTMEPEMKKYLFDVCKGMAHLHDCGWAHRDMKPGNCLIKLNGDAAITDFSFGTQATAESISTSYLGTFPYQSGQIMFRIPYRPQAADVWAIGCTIFRCLTLERLFEIQHNDYASIKEKAMAERTDKVRNSRISEEAKDLIYNCLIWEESERWTMSQILNHPFFESLRTPDQPSRMRVESSTPARIQRYQEGSKTSSGRGSSSGPSTRQTPLPGNSGTQLIKGEKRQLEDGNSGERPQKHRARKS